MSSEAAPSVLLHFEYPSRISEEMYKGHESASYQVLFMSQAGSRDIKFETDLSWIIPNDHTQVSNFADESSSISTINNEITAPPINTTIRISNQTSNFTVTSHEVPEPNNATRRGELNSSSAGQSSKDIGSETLNFVAYSSINRQFL
ncbi:OLC1v1019026C2 [Oldenlandia corymbosa var. corymbosa]|uniref:OLC1v1019026C2 n=1 Tax=Oldenlandia corymbosa var. corymbosa TaxID=529605 RepID=A0AAV1ED40_OLDCO|nr:OLC1v1019026C2 [Oldenlandia corymbosa var. corymbosa]